MVYNLGPAKEAVATPEDSLGVSEPVVTQTKNVEGDNLGQDSIGTINELAGNLPTDVHFEASSV